jgi:hypothetical protein
MLITNGTVLTLGDNPRVIPGGAVYFEEDTVIEVGSSAELTAKHRHEETLDARGKIVMPGLTCGRSTAPSPWRTAGIARWWPWWTPSATALPRS